MSDGDAEVTQSRTVVCSSAERKERRSAISSAGAEHPAGDAEVAAGVVGDLGLLAHRGEDGARGQAGGGSATAAKIKVSQRPMRVTRRTSVGLPSSRRGRRGA